LKGGVEVLFCLAELGLEGSDVRFRFLELLLVRKEGVIVACLGDFQGEFGGFEGLGIDTEIVGKGQHGLSSFDSLSGAEMDRLDGSVEVGRDDDFGGWGEGSGF
jgi:hypothetical protein